MRMFRWLYATPGRNETTALNLSVAVAQMQLENLGENISRWRVTSNAIGQKVGWEKSQLNAGDVYLRNVQSLLVVKSIHLFKASEKKWRNAVARWLIILQPNQLVRKSIKVDGLRLYRMCTRAYEYFLCLPRVQVHTPTTLRQRDFLYLLRLIEIDEKKKTRGNSAKKINRTLSQFPLLIALSHFNSSNVCKLAFITV